MPVLETIHGHKDLIGLNEQQRRELCEEIRQFLIQHVSRTGGHLASNLGVVELSVAIETVYNTMQDRLVFDVGHQSYVHKLLTDRQTAFLGLRQFGGMAGFPKPSESDADAFVAGHASSSVSIALGMARARTLKKENHHVIALMGDGAATGGMAYEGLNDAAVSGESMVIILNDNAMSIDRNVGGMASHLRSLRTKERYLGMKRRSRSFLSKIPGGKYLIRFTSAVKGRLRRMLIPSTIFESMGFSYLGPVDGHDTEHLIYLLREARDMKRPVVLHVTTQKGKGYLPAQENPRQFHGIGAFDPATGKPLKESGPSYSGVFGKQLCNLAQEDSRICAITAAMPSGTGLMEFKERFADRFFDVGIAEEHAMSMAGGLSKSGMIPVVALYSTFLQRSYDMILQDICMLNLHTVLCVDRAGLVGEDGETHHGIYDVGFLSQAPGMQILCPGNFAELSDMLSWAVKDQDGPVAIRYPRGGERIASQNGWNASAPLVCSGDGSLAIITYGNLAENALQAAELLKQQGVQAKVIRLTKIWPLPKETILQALMPNSTVLVAEEACGGIGQSLVSFLCQNGHKAICADLGAQFVTHGSVEKLYEKYGLDAPALARRALEVYQHEN